MSHSVWVGGDGPPVLLLHGYPQTHATWLHVAPVLARQFTVVVPDLRGYGASDAPAADDSHTVNSKREMAADQAEIMAQLGFPEYAVVGHDRGARVTYRMALDFPGHVTPGFVPWMLFRLMIPGRDSTMRAVSVLFIGHFLPSRRPCRKP